MERPFRSVAPRRPRWNTRQCRWTMRIVCPHWARSSRSVDNAEKFLSVCCAAGFRAGFCPLWGHKQTTDLTSWGRGCPLCPESGQTARGLAKSALCRYCCRSRRLKQRDWRSIFGTVLTIRPLQSGDTGMLTYGTGYARHGSAAGGGRATSFASRRRFCAIAARVNSSCAPHGPRNRRRPSRKMRLR